MQKDTKTRQIAAAKKVTRFKMVFWEVEELAESPHFWHPQSLRYPEHLNLHLWAGCDFWYLWQSKSD